MKSCLYLLVLFYSSVQLAWQHPQIQSRIILDTDDPTHHRDFDSCESPTILWKEDGECYPLGERGPCGPGELLILSRKNYQAECTKSVLKLSKTTESEALVVESADPEEPSDAVCNQNEQVFWPQDGQCYTLLQQGPCEDGQWLILDADNPSTNPLRAKCVEMPCENPEEQVLWNCQCVDANEDIRSGRYTPEEVLGPHTQLVWSIYGHGVKVCDDGFYEDDNGRCYALGSQGPCAVGEVWEFEEGSLTCLNINKELNVRVFDLVAHDQRLTVIVKCYQDSMGKCRKTLGLNVKRFGASDFETWAKSVVPISQECKQCPGDKILWTDGHCYQPASTGPCPADEWLVLEGIFDGRPVMRCIKRQCPGSQVWWEPTCTCVQTDRQGRQLGDNRPCGGANYRLLVDPYGKGVCSCEAGYKLDEGLCIPDTDVDLTKFVNVRNNLQSNIANQINCNTVEDGFCTKDYISEDHEVTDTALEDLISWLESFPEPTESCGDSIDKGALKELEDTCAQENKIVYQGECAELLTSEPCGNTSQWLILEKMRNELVPICEPRPCPDDQIYYEKDCECHPLSSVPCTPNEDVFINIFGHGTCGCKKDSVIYPQDGKCYPIGERGPCGEDEVLLLEDDLGQCVQCPEQFIQDEQDVSEESDEDESRQNNERFFFGSLKEDDEFVNPRNKRQVVFKKLQRNTASEGDKQPIKQENKFSRCFKPGTQGKCPTGMQVGLNSDSSALKCVTSEISDADNNTSQTVKATPENCALDSRGRCRRTKTSANSAEERSSLFSRWLDSFLPWAPDVDLCIQTVILPF